MPQIQLKIYRPWIGIQSIVGPLKFSHLHDSPFLYSSLYFSQVIPEHHEYKCVFTTSVINFAELLGLRPDLVKCRKIVYFHENQLTYPVNKTRDFDFQHSQNDISSALVADLLLFNSNFNRESFLQNCDKVLKKVPETSLVPIRDRLEVKCDVMPVPVDFSKFPNVLETSKTGVLKIVWPHRWEHDKNPGLLKEILEALKRLGCKFVVSILGDRTATIPKEFEEIETLLRDSGQLTDFGFLNEKSDYYRVLSESDIVLSTSNHEFQGVAILEAVHCGCYPLCPNRLVYPEYLPKDCLYATTQQAIKFLRKASENIESFRKRTLKIDLDQFSWQRLEKRYTELLQVPITDDSVIEYCQKKQRLSPKPEVTTFDDLNTIENQL